MFYCAAADTAALKALHLSSLCPASFMPFTSAILTILDKPFSSRSSHTHLLYIPLSIPDPSTHIYRLL
jgi:hypothetical protein